MSDTMYYLVKEGVYDQGVYWIGQDLTEGSGWADHHATADRDDYHEWNVRKGFGSQAERMYTGVRDE